jgi:stage V sporulation protein G
METLKCTKVEVAILKASRKQKTLADVKVVLNEQLQLTGLKIEDGEHGFYVAYPQTKNNDDVIPWVFYPLSKELRDHIELCVLEKYQELCLA